MHVKWILTPFICCRVTRLDQILADFFIKYFDPNWQPCPRGFLTVRVEELKAVLNPVAGSQPVDLLRERYNILCHDTLSVDLMIITKSFSINDMNAVRSTSMGWPVRSYNAMTKWKKFDLRRLDGGCFSKWERPMPGATRNVDWRRLERRGKVK